MHNQCALFNAPLLQVLSSTEMSNLLAYLTPQSDNAGLGVATVQRETGIVSLRKGLKFSVTEATTHIQQTMTEWDASWALFVAQAHPAGHHAHRARFYQPCQVHDLVLVHHGQNGEKGHWADLGTHGQMSEAECLTRLWATLALPLNALLQQSGVFMGFKLGTPFVIKGQMSGQLVLAMHAATGAVLFCTDLPLHLTACFDAVLRLGSFSWSGQQPDDVQRLISKAQEEEAKQQAWLATLAQEMTIELASTNPPPAGDDPLITVDSLRAYLVKRGLMKTSLAARPSSDHAF